MLGLAKVTHFELLLFMPVLSHFAESKAVRAVKEKDPLVQINFFPSRIFSPISGKDLELMRREMNVPAFEKS